MNRKLRFSKIYFLGLVLTFMLFLCTGRQVYTHLTMNYAEDPSGDAFVTVYGENGVLHEGMVEEGKADLFFWGSDITGISPIHYNTFEEIYLESIQIRVHGETVAKMDGEAILKYFTPNDGIQEMKLCEQGVSLTTRSDQPVMQLSSQLCDQIDRMAVFMSSLNLFFYVMVWTFIYWYLFRVLDLKNDRSYGNLLDGVLGLVGIAAILLAWNIAFTSAYGGTVHPDEMQTRAAVDYYRTHWIQPDVRSDFVATTVSGYGMTRMSEINLYYLFAGKFANLCGFATSFRALGMLMIAVLGCFVLKNIKKERYMAILFFATPQLWYLFSYATSDAYDYLFTVIAAYEILSENSALNRILRQSFKGKHIPTYLTVGFVFANLLMAKKTFYVVLATIFMLLLYRLVFAQKDERKKLFVKYICLLAVAFSVVLIRYFPDFGYYGLNKGAAVEQVIEATALPEYKPSTPAIQQAKSTLLFEKGVTLKEFFKDWKFNTELFKNYFGYYGIYSLRAEDWYYVLMAALYIALFAWVGLLVHREIKRQKAAGKPVVRVRLTYWTMWGMILLMYLLTIYNAYFVDFQPQGRYLFPALPALACQIGLYKKVEEHQGIRTLITAIAVMSLYSFYKIAYLNF